ncbi:uncharacterized protein PV06_05286 [Exophiala oligosperma]|uniref:Telomeric single stranded DNA binding POT1/Cdc13 domain-containing protein n=1 Tax=Exophiala oligosperma TaxID=215243 RepID=A0A0D2E8Q5_9EURO|nr:uncharacterized protein PV06_05286 [Exophiala oligosperma]KIW44264.1 hypothetical protein PV06_05286 [Exophiala oligosperma]
MTTVAVPNLSSQPAFEASERISIASLSPTTTGAASYILASVALVWPYSSSTRTLALLLADSDIPVRKPRGQVKVIFHDGSAREVAKTKVGIGDLLHLGLAGCKWQENKDNISTPGKKISWNLVFQGQVTAEILRDNAEATTINYTAHDDHLGPGNSILETLDTLQDATPKRNGSMGHELSTIHVPLITPSRSGRRYSGKTFFDTSLDIFTDDDGYVAGHGRKRTKFARDSGGWNLVDMDEDAEPIPRTPQPPVSTTEETGTTAPTVGLPSEMQASTPTGGVPNEESLGSHTRDNDQVHLLDNEIGSLGSSGGNPSSAAHQSGSQIRSPSREPKLTSMGPPQTPMRIPHLPARVIDATTPTETSSNATTTPRLHPLASPGLPLVSPLIQKYGVEIGYFPPFEDGVSQLDASGTSTAEDESNDRTNSFSSFREGVSTHIVAHEEHHDGVEAPGAPTTEDDSDGSLVVLDSFPNQQPASTKQILQPPMDEQSSAIAVNHHHGSESVGETADHHYDPENPASTATELWLSNTELAIEEGRFQQEHELTSRHLESSTPQIIEIEDDDLYGAPSDVAPRSPPVNTQDISRDQQKSALDVIEEFLQISPVQPSGTATAWGNKAKILETSPSRENSEPYIEMESTYTTVEHTPFPFLVGGGSTQQSQPRLAGSESSPRSSPAMPTQNHSMDGNVDERETLAVIEEQALDHATFHLEAHTTERQRLVISDDIPELAIASAEAAKDIAMTEAREMTSEQVENSLPALQSSNVLPTPKIDLASAALTYLEDGDARLGSPPASHEDSHAELVAEIEISPVGQEPVVRSREDIRVRDRDDDSVVEVGQDVSSRDVVQESFNSVTSVETPAQLPTPDHTQPDQLAVNARRIASSPELQTTTTLAEHQPQGDSIAPSGEGPIGSAQEGADSGTAVSQIQEEIETNVPRRLSQRLSTRRSVMPANISSPYFTPRRSARTSSPTSSQKENVKPSTTSPSNLPSSPTQAHRTSNETIDISIAAKGGGGTIVSAQQEPHYPISRTTGITTQHAYYPPLASLDEHFNHLVDVIGVCVDDSFQPERAKSGPREYFTTLRVADSSCKQDGVNVRVFRPVKTALPNTRRGDVVLLRDFKSQTLNRKFMLLSTDTSSWAVFCSTEGETSRRFEVLVTGPPVEYGSTEEDYVALLRSWWRDGGSALFPSSGTTSDIKSSGTPHLKPRPANRRRSNRTDNMDNETDQIDANGEVENATPLADKTNENGRGPSVQGTPSESKASPEPTSRRRVGSRRSGIPTDEVQDTIRTTHVGDKAPAGTKTDVNDRRRSIAPSASLSPNISMREFTPRRSARHKRSVTPAAEGQGHDGASFGSMEIREGSASAGRRGSTVSIASATTPKPTGRESAAPRRSARHKSPSVVHELRDGTKYVDNDDGQQRAGSVLHELRDGSTYVDG